jgi:HPr kinase/phosphorylase
MLVHATTIDIAGCGVLILGEPGAGKSDLALRLIADGAWLVADDQTVVEIAGERLRASAPAAIVGLIEVRGLGIARAPVKRATWLCLAVSLVATATERMPESRTWSLPRSPKPGIPLIELNAFEPSAREKVRRALAAVLSS